MSKRAIREYMFYMIYKRTWRKVYVLKNILSDLLPKVVHIASKFSVLKFAICNF